MAVTESYGTIELGAAGRNAEYLGTLVAWLVINNMLDVQVERSAGSRAARVRMQDLTGSAFLTTVLHGEIKPAHLNEAGRKFVEHYVVSGRYREDFDNRDYRGENEWILYDEMAPKITAAYRRHKAPVASRVAKIIKFPGPRRKR